MTSVDHEPRGAGFGTPTNANPGAPSSGSSPGGTGLPVADLDAIARKPIRITVAGHANHGKTSIVRTLTEDERFGQVDDRAGVTKRVTEREISLAGKTFLRIFDTPGFQHAGDALDQCGDDAPIETILEHFRTHDDQDEFLLLQRCRDSDVILYVIDVSQAPTEDFKDEFRLLARSKVPVIPLMNFLQAGSPKHREAWVDFLQRHNYHDFTPYDAHIRYDDAEELLLDRIRLKLRDPAQSAFLRWWITYRHAQVEKRVSRCASILAAMLLDVAAYRERRSGLGADQRADVQAEMTAQFQDTVREREAATARQLVYTFEFDPSRLHGQVDPTEADSVWSTDLFGPEVRRHFRIGAIGGALGGATVGGMLDVVTAGSTLLVGSMLGAASGAVLGVIGGGLYNTQFDRVTQSLGVETGPNIWRVLIGRGIALTTDLRFRGRADTRTFLVTTKPPKLDKARLSELNRLLESARTGTRLSAEQLADPNGPRTPRIESLREPVRQSVMALLTDAYHERRAELPTL